MSDILTEWEFGEGVFRTIGRFIVHGNSEEGSNLFAGVVLGKPEGADGCHQMWECELIVIPRRKFTSGKHGSFNGYSIDQLLTTTNFGQHDLWEDGKGNLGKPYWEKLK